MVLGVVIGSHAGGAGCLVARLRRWRRAGCRPRRDHDLLRPLEPEVLRKAQSGDAAQTLGAPPWHDDTLAESTPVQEAERLQADLRRAGIEPYGWVINASLSVSATAHKPLRARAACEGRHIERVREGSDRTWLVAWQAEPPVGPAGLRRLGAGAPVA